MATAGTSEVNDVNVSTELNSKEARYRRAVAAVVAAGTGSIKVLQDAIGASLGEAVELLVQMNEDCLVGESVNGKGRPVLVSEVPEHLKETLVERFGRESEEEQEDRIDAGGGPVLCGQEERDAELLRITEDPEAASAGLERVGETMQRVAHSGDPSEIRWIPIAKIDLDPNNPRKYFDEVKLREMAATIERNGLIHPITIRPHGDRFRVVAGARRLMACKLIGREVIESRVRNLTDDQAYEIRLIENLQDENIDALDEANGFYDYLNRERPAGEARPTIEQLAERVGKSKEYVHQRLKLRSLIPEAMEAVVKGEMSAAHGVDCARLEPQDQRDYLSVFREHGGASVRSMRNWINEQVRIDLARAPFSLKDDSLLANVPACIACPKSSIAQPDLFAGLVEIEVAPAGKRKKGEKKTSLCFDGACYQRKVGAFVQQTAIRFSEQEGAEALPVFGGPRWQIPAGSGEGILSADDFVECRKGDCEYAEAGIIVGGEQVGKTLFLCRNQQCTVHFAIVAHMAHRKDTGAAMKMGDGSSLPGHRPDEHERQVKSEAAAADRERQRERSARELAFLRIRRKIVGKRISTADLRDIVEAFYLRLHYDNQKRLAKLYGWKSKERDLDPLDVIGHANRGSLYAILLGCALVDDIGAIGDPDRLQAAGLRYGVSLSAIRHEMQSPKKAKKGATRGRR